jgi:DNA-binding NarL/FixJ family response regulator
MPNDLGPQPFDNPGTGLLRLFKENEWAAIRRMLRLSPRESQIVLGILAGETEGIIADRLGISVHTVHCHMTRVYRKLKVNSRPDLLIRIFSAYLSLARELR